MDMSGEPLFMERLMQRFHRRAIEQNISVVSSCGIDSIPADLGTAFLKANFDGTLNQVEHYLQLWSKEEHFSYATWLALIEGYKGRKKLKQVRRDIFQQFYKPFTFDVPLGEYVCLLFIRTNSFYRRTETVHEEQLWPLRPLPGQ